MKNLSIEEKAKRYDEAIEIAKSELNSLNKRLIEYIFHELKENKVEPKLLDGVGMKRLKFSYEQIQAIENYVKKYVEFKMNENENNDK